MRPVYFRAFIAMVGIVSPKGNFVRLNLIAVVMASSLGTISDAAATYPQCIEMLHAMLNNQNAILTAMGAQDMLIAKAMNDGLTAFAPADKANMKAQTDIDAAFKAYTDALGDACQAMR